MAPKFMKVFPGSARGAGLGKKRVDFVPLEEKSLWELGFDLWGAAHNHLEPSNYINIEGGIIDGILAELFRRDREWLEFMEWQKDKDLWRSIKREMQK